MLKYHFGESDNPDAFGSLTTRDQDRTMVLLADTICLTIISGDILRSGGMYDSLVGAAGLAL